MPEKAAVKTLSHHLIMSCMITQIVAVKAGKAIQATHRGSDRAGDERGVTFQVCTVEADLYSTKSPFVLMRGRQQMGGGSWTARTWSMRRATRTSARPLQP